MEIERVSIEGSPGEIGRDVFLSLCLPVMMEAQESGIFSPGEIAQLFAGFISAALGVAAAQLGKEEARALALKIAQGLDLVDFTKGTH